MSKRDYRNYAKDILEHIQDIEEFVENINWNCNIFLDTQLRY